MAELLIKIGDNFPHKDLMLDLHTTDADAKQVWIEREAEKLRNYWEASSPLTVEQSIQYATQLWEEQKYRSTREGDIIQVRRDGWEWGDRESYPRFIIARINTENLAFAGFEFSGKLDQQRIWDLEKALKENNEDALKLMKRQYYLSDVSSLKPDSIIEIPLSLISAKSEYIPYDPEKASPHASAGTFTIKSSGGNYTTLSSWETGEACDLVTAEALCIAECYNDWPSGLTDDITVDDGGWTTNSSYYPKIYTPAGERHNGIAKSGGDYTGFALEGSGASRGVLEYDYDFYADGIIINAEGGARDCIKSLGVTGSVYVEHMVLYGAGISRNIFRSSGGETLRFSNSVMYDSGGDGFSPAPAHFYVQYITARDITTIGFKEEYSTTKVYTNCLADDCGTGFSSVGNNAVINYCASSDQTADDCGGNGNIVGASVTFADAASDDFHLAAGDTDVIGQGTPLHADGNYPVSDDIDGDTRDLTAPDIGADEYVGGAPPAGNPWYYYAQS